MFITFCQVISDISYGYEGLLNIPTFSSITVCMNVISIFFFLFYVYCTCKHSYCYLYWDTHQAKHTLTHVFHVISQLFLTFTHTCMLITFDKVISDIFNKPTLCSITIFIKSVSYQLQTQFKLT